ncbi:hypothetical protein, partial [Bilophila wadsworthia]|uniref:hypothetical protein n=1 Tax=Bilophila wadsworthia TaxID=35833 RepID=UPI001B805C8F
MYHSRIFPERPDSGWRPRRRGSLNPSRSPIKEKPPLISRKALFHGTTGNRDSIKSKIFEEEREGFGEGEGKLSLESFPS